MQPRVFHELRTIPIRRSYPLGKWISSNMSANNATQCKQVSMSQSRLVACLHWIIGRKLYGRRSLLSFEECKEEQLGFRNEALW